MDSSSSSDVEMQETPPELKDEADLVINNLFPAKSKEKYIKAYENFMKWRTEKNAASLSESIFLAYFNELAKNKLPSTLWAMYSMIKFTVKLKHKVDIKSYSNLTSFLKRQSEGFKSKKAKVFTAEQISQFLNEAPDSKYLATKVALILGVNGACRSTELYNLKVKDVKWHDDVFIVNLRDTKTKIDSLFVVREEYHSIIQSYQVLRPAATKLDNFFLQYRSGKCINQVIGKHKIYGFPKEVAAFLKLPDSESFTGHSFRRTAATLLADTGANLTTLKRHGGWRSDRVAEGYIEESVSNKTNISNIINKNIKFSNQPSTSRQEPNPPSDNAFQRSSSQPSTSRSNSIKLGSSPNQRHMSTSPKGNQNPASIQNTQTEIQQNNITVPGKTVNLSFHNCTMSNINFYN